MYALSIHQPWAWAIMHAGKVVENRKWRTNHRGPLLVHASKSRASYDGQALGRFERRFGATLPPWEELATGAVLGVVEVVDCVRSVHALPERVEVPGLGECPWADPDCWCWVLANPRAFPTPVVCRGGQRLFKVPDEVVPAAFR